MVASRSFSGGGLRSNDSGFNISYKVGIKVSGNSNRICCRIKRKSSRDRRTVTMDCRSPCYNRYICQYLPFVGEPRSTTLDLPFHILLYTQLCLHPVSLHVQLYTGGRNLYQSVYGTVLYLFFFNHNEEYKNVKSLKNRRSL